MTYWPEGTPREDQPIWNRFRGMCIVCFAPAVALHEDPPKSLRPKTWRDHPEDRFLLCDEHHHEAQAMSREAAQKWLADERRTAIQFWGEEVS